MLFDFLKLTDNGKVKQVINAWGMHYIIGKYRKLGKDIDIRKKTHPPKKILFKLRLKRN